MSENKHTPEPWGYHKTVRFGDTRFSIAQEKGAPFTPYHSDVAALICLETTPIEYVDIQEANARRIVACVNACAGISDDVLEDNGIAKLREDRDMLLKQRDDLLAASEAALQCIGEMGPTRVRVEVFVMLQEAIASVKESK